MALRPLASFAAIVLVLALAVEARAQDSPVPDAAKPAPAPAKPASAPAKKTKAKGRSSSRPAPGPRSPGDETDAAPSLESARKPRTEQATFGAGCFWHVEAVFEQLKGVNSAVSGYAGGSVPNPSYEMVHEGTTGHAEVVMVDYDPEVITYQDLLKVFWANHDPTSINRQGEDEGPQYRSVIFYHTEEQRRAAFKSFQDLTARRVFRSPIVTQLAPMVMFYPAEYYHQDFYGGKARPSRRRGKTTAAKARKSTAGATKKARSTSGTPKPAQESATDLPEERSAPNSQP
jgi:peptide-methionine (S)-S-oxide reductase